MSPSPPYFTVSAINAIRSPGSRGRLGCRTWPRQCAGRHCTWRQRFWALKSGCKCIHIRCFRIYYCSRSNICWCIDRYDAKADLWSVGTILFELLTGRCVECFLHMNNNVPERRNGVCRPPFRGRSQLEVSTHCIKNQIKNDLRPHQPVTAHAMLTAQTSHSTHQHARLRHSHTTPSCASAAAEKYPDTGTSASSGRAHQQSLRRVVAGA